MASLSLPIERKLFNPLWWREMLFQWQSQSHKISSASDVDAGTPESKVVEVHQVNAPSKASSAYDFAKVPKDGVTITVTGIYLLVTLLGVSTNTLTPLELESEDDLEVEEDRAVTIISEPEPTDWDKLASDILDVIGDYGLHTQPKDVDGPVTGWAGKSFFMDRVRTQVAKGHAIEMILPAFPWKSVSNTQISTNEA